MPKLQSARRRTTLLLAALFFVFLVAVFPRVKPYLLRGNASGGGVAVSDVREGEDLAEDSELAPSLGEAGAGDGITTRTLAMPVPLGHGVYEYDFPSLAMTPDGTAWLSYVSFDPGPPIRRGEVIAGNFDSLRMSDLGDTVRLTSYANGEWGEASQVTPTEQNVWKPIVVSDSKGDLLIVWSQPFEGNWDLYSRWYSPARQHSLPLAA